MSNLQELEIQVAFLQRFVDQLNEVVTDQSKTIDRLEKRIVKLDQTVQSVKQRLPEEPGDPTDERPPHY